MSDAIDLHARLEALERSVRRQRLALASLALALGVVGLASWTSGDPQEVRAQRFVAVDDHGVEVGSFGFQRAHGAPSVGWNLNHHESGATAFCYVGRDPEDGSPSDKGCAGFQMEAGWAISQHFVRELGSAIGLSYVIGEDEKTAARLTADESTAQLVLSPLPHGDILSEESDDSHALRLSYDAQGPRITGTDLEGAAKLDLR